MADWNFRLHTNGFAQVIIQDGRRWGKTRRAAEYEAQYVRESVDDGAALRDETALIRDHG